MLQEMQELGYPLHEYQPPVCFNYVDRVSGRYLGTIMLWRYRRVPPISLQTLETMRGLEHFVIHLFSNIIMRYSLLHPARSTFALNVKRLDMDFDMTSHELKVFLLGLNGLSHGEIARRLGFSINTIRKHVQKIYRKTDSYSFIGIFTRRYMPWLEDFSGEFWAEIDAVIKNRRSGQAKKKSERQITREWIDMTIEEIAGKPLSIDFRRHPFRGILTEIAREDGVRRQSVQRRVQRGHPGTLARVAEKVRERREVIEDFRRTVQAAAGER